jgi:hypothetical protein
VYQEPKHQNGGKKVEYNKKSPLKVECIASQDDFEFFGVTLDDVLDRTPAGFGFLKRLKELCAMTQNVKWTNVAYTLNIAMLNDDRVSFEFSECIEDYIIGLKNSLIMADEKTKAPLQDFIDTLENTDEDEARLLISKFEKNIRNERK